MVVEKEVQVEVEIWRIRFECFGGVGAICLNQV